MIDSVTLAAFVAAGLVLIAIPGPDMLFVIAQGAASGPRGGLAAGLGVAAGNLAHTALVTAGAAALLRGEPAAFAALRLAGVGYLLLLAAGAARAALAGGNGSAEAPRAVGSVWAAFRRGAAMNALNPKVALFFLAFLPQFADPARGPVWAQTALLGALFVLLVAAIYGPLGAAAGRIGSHLARRGTGRAGVWCRWALVAVYAGLAARLAADAA